MNQLQQQLKLWKGNITNRYFKYNIYTARRGIAKGLKRKGGLGFLPSFKTTSKELLFYKSLDLRNNVIYDVGANRGLFSIYFAKATGPDGLVFSFEPNPYLHPQILGNIEVNLFNNVQIYQYAIGEKVDYANMYFDMEQPGKGTLSTGIQKFYEKTSGNLESINVKVYSLDYLVNILKFPRPQFIKIDVEGYEYEVLLGAKDTLEKCKPTLFIEIHGATISDKVSNIKQIAVYLWVYKYELFHIESENYINMENIEIAKEGHIYCLAL